MQNKRLCFTVLLIALFGSQAISSSSAYSFNFDYFGNGSDLISFHGDVEYGPATDGMSRSEALALSRDNIPFSHGRALFIKPIPFKPSSSSLYSFETSFTFTITPRQKNHNSGHDLAFIVVPTNRNNAVSDLGFLSLLNRNRNGNPNNHLFAVEFDVFQDKYLGAINDNHVEIDINSVKSKALKKKQEALHRKTFYQIFYLGKKKHDLGFLMSCVLFNVGIN